MGVTCADAEPGELILQRDQPRRVAVRQRAQPDGVQQREDRDVGADAEREHRDDGAGREPFARQRARAVSQILEQRLEPRHHAHLPHRLGDSADVAEGGARLGLGFAAGQARAHAAGDARLEMEPHLGLELALQRVSAETD